MPREELRREEEQYKIGNATRRARQKEEGPHMQGRKVSATLPTGELAEGVEVLVEESNERWSEFTFTDGTVVRAKMTIVSSVQVNGRFDQQGNPLYSMNLAPVITIVSVPEQYRQKVRFEALRLRWYEEAGDTSSITRIVTCPSYYGIIGMGPVAVPLILRQMESEGDDPDHWSWALRSITGENPIREDAIGDTVKIAEAWLAWGRSRYVW